MSDNVIGLAAGRIMSDADYEAERRRILETYGDSRSEAGTRWEQALANLFYVSGWTQERLAAKEGKSQRWVAYRLVFGRFLAFSGNSTLCSKLTEGRFRDAWDQTDKTEGNERIRFRAVEKLLAERDERLEKRVNPIGKAIREKYMDGKFHSPEAMAREVAAPLEDVIQTLELMTRRVAATYQCEKKRVPASGGRHPYHYRLFPMNKTVSLTELADKLGPIVTKLRSQGKRNMATISIAEIANIAEVIQQYLDEWSQ